MRQLTNRQKNRLRYMRVSSRVQVMWMSFVAFLTMLVSCDKKAATTEARPAFSADTAYMHIERQVMMGPRVPDTKAHTECILYMLDRLQAYGATTECQQGTMTDYSGKERHVTNVIGHFGQPQANGRVLLGAHYDSRPWCDEEEEYENRFLAVPGANDGASGVGVLLEVARQIGLMASDSSKAAPNVDIVFFDCEDMGTPAFYTGAERTDTWCLGSQLWASEMSKNRQMRSRFQYGIVLDMVGAPDAVFPKEYHSMRWGGNYVEKIWRTANRLGHGRYFVQGECYPITDDHYYVNKIAGIPCVDVVNYSTTGTGFPSWWHTQRDDMSNISRETLQAVGETVMKVIGK